MHVIYGMAELKMFAEEDDDSQFESKKGHKSFESNQRTTAARPCRSLAVPLHTEH